MVGNLTNLEKCRLVVSCLSFGLAFPFKLSFTLMK